MPCFWRAIQSELSPPVTRKKWLVPSALNSSAIASAAVVIAGLLARPRSDQPVAGPHYAVPYPSAMVAIVGRDIKTSSRSEIQSGNLVRESSPRAERLVDYSKHVGHPSEEVTMVTRPDDAP